jgi:hypothetical protein
MQLCNAQGIASTHCGSVQLYVGDPGYMRSSCPCKLLLHAMSVAHTWHLPACCYDQCQVVRCLYMCALPSGQCSLNARWLCN